MFRMPRITVSLLEVLESIRGIVSLTDVKWRQFDGRYHHHLRKMFDRLETVVVPFEAGKRLASSTGHLILRPCGS